MDMQVGDREVVVVPSLDTGSGRVPIFSGPGPAAEEVLPRKQCNTWQKPVAWFVGSSAHEHPAGQFGEPCSATAGLSPPPPSSRLEIRPGDWSPRADETLRRSRLWQSPTVSVPVVSIH